MKQVQSLILLVILGCNPNPQPLKTETNENLNQADSVLNQNRESLVTVDRSSKKGDSSIIQKVEQTVKQITTLKQENQQLKKENDVLKVQLIDANDTGKPFKLLPVSNSQDNR
jgi:hypothetical protein